MGSITSLWEHFSDWKKVSTEKEARSVSLETVIRGTCDKVRLLDIIENFILFEQKKVTAKIVARYHQYYGVNRTLEGLNNIEELQGKLGVFWHTQGSGKSFSMVFLCQKAFRKLTGNWTFVIITDRTDLDDQIYKTFNACGLVKENCQAESAAQLKQLLSEDRRFVFSLIHKFRTDQGESYQELSNRSDVVVITDEAHRSQYSSLALNMRSALPRAGFIAFTGTPLLGNEPSADKTREVFGEYVSVYNFADAVDDGATLPLYYENRVPEVNFDRQDIGDEIKSIVENAELSDESEAKIEREFARSYHIITRDDRLETIAKDLVEHFITREPFSSGVRGKAMVVAIDKATAIKMHNKVQTAWVHKIAELEALKDAGLPDWAEPVSGELLSYMRETDMAVVVSGSQGDYEAMQRRGLDFEPHRLRMVKEDLDNDFKDADHPLRIVFLCAMWLTGFDAPCVSTLYLDKPLKRHTLMQTIARANRVYPGKASGQVVDYINVFGALQEALGVYGGVSSGEDGGYAQGGASEPKSVLVEKAREAIDESKVFLSGLNISVDYILAAESENFDKQLAIQNAVETLMLPINIDTFFSHVRRINRIFKALLPDNAANEMLADRALLCLLYKIVFDGMGEAIDDDDVLHVVRTQVDALLDEAIITVKIQANLPRPVNIAQIDFDALSAMLERTKTPSISDVERLKRIVELRIEPMIDGNPTRIDFQERFNEIVSQYNLGAHSAEEFFEQLREFVDQLNDEDRRAAREELKEPELTIFDLLCQEVELSSKEREGVKKLARVLLESLSDALVIDWRKRQRTKARVQKVIDDVLQNLPESFDDASWENACDKIYMHVFDKHHGPSGNSYSL